MMKRIFVLLILFSSIAACKKDGDTKHYNPGQYIIRLNSPDIRECALSIPMGSPALFYTGNRLWALDYRAYTDHVIYELSGDNYDKAKGYLKIGKGPGEIIRAGDVTVHGGHVYVNDNGRSSIWMFSLDSMLLNPDLINGKEILINDGYILSNIYFVNDSIAVSLAVHPLSISTFEKKVVKGNLRSFEFSEWGYEHPEALGRTISSSNLVRLKDGGFARCYLWLDLITILNPDGTLRCNIYGSHWNQHDMGEYEFSHDICVYKDYFLVSYVGDVSDITDSNGRSRGNLPSRVLVFDNSGKHLATIEFGEKFNRMAVDEQKQRLVFTFYEREAMLGYIDLEPILRNIR
ncbi:MAG: hypothetical protein KBA42_06415 [Bacteroidales bacterium]|nr:hypothetical protein [Bacteroidales bacterium]MBP9028564.1 hypothetical protein [Bacteroidales bacterium]NMC99248.1 hypothetical protein [Bacteroidales bacterium]HRR11041.1 hypothetical protein [Tenuifilum sp.]